MIGVILFVIGIYLFILPTIFRTYNIWTYLYFKALPFLLGAFLILYGGKQIQFFIELFELT